MSDSQELAWSFPSTGGITVDGFHDSASEHFRGDYEHYLIRESIQNSLDAHADEKAPVRVVFEYATMTMAHIPGMAQFRDIVKKARDFSADQDGATEFYDQALEDLRKSSLPVLRIGDYNTKGLDGDDDDFGNNWARLVFMEGGSSSKGASGGSFGIGKASAFTASGVRAVLYSTLNSSKEHVFAGKARISSWKAEDGDIRRGIGVLSRSSKSVRDLATIPAHLQRNEQGTDIYVLDYHPLGDDWKTAMINSALINFWPAICENKLVVEFKDRDSTVVINAENLKTMLEEHEAASQQAMPFYVAMTSGEVTEKELKHLGKVKLHYAFGREYPREVMYMRKPKMKVNSWQVYSLRREYAAVLVCEGEPGNGILRLLEPPAHDNWDPSSEKGKYKAAYAELRKFVRETMSALNSAGDYKPEDVADLGKYLPDKDERDDLQNVVASLGKPAGTVSDQESPVEVANPLPPKPLPVTPPPEVQVLTVVKAARGEDADRWGTKSRTNATHDDKASESEGGNLPRVDTSGLRFRSMTYMKDGHREYMLILSPDKDSAGAIRLMAAGEDADYPVTLLSASTPEGSPLPVKGSFISDIELKAGEAKKLAIRLSNDRRYALGVESHER